MLLKSISQRLETQAQALLSWPLDRRLNTSTRHSSRRISLDDCFSCSKFSTAVLTQILFQEGKYTFPFCRCDKNRADCFGLGYEPWKKAPFPENQKI